jgi:hypothetical protein
MFVGFISLFAIPKVYIMKKDMIHKNVENLTSQVGATFDNVIKKVPKYSDLKED